MIGISGKLCKMFCVNVQTVALSRMIACVFSKSAIDDEYFELVRDIFRQINYYRFHTSDRPVINLISSYVTFCTKKMKITIYDSFTHNFINKSRSLRYWWFLSYLKTTLKSPYIHTALVVFNHEVLLYTLLLSFAANFAFRKNVFVRASFLRFDNCFNIDECNGELFYTWT